MPVPILTKRRERKQAELATVIGESVDKAISPMLAQASQANAHSGATYGVNNQSSPFAQTGGFGGAFNPLPRPDDVFSSLFGPGYPLVPDPLDSLDSQGRAQPRRWQFPVTWNVQLFGDRAVPWSVLTRLSSDCDVISRCIELVQDALIGLEWSWGFSQQILQQIMQETGETNSAKANLLAREKYGDELGRVQAFFERPDKRMGQTFSEWLAGMIWASLVYDGICVYPQYALGGELLSMSLIDTASIKLLLDDQGFSPQPPAPAYQQILYGFPRGEFQAEGVESDGSVPNGFQSDQLFYRIRRPRPHTPYGFSAVEECINIATIYQARQKWLHAEYCYDESTEVLTDKGWQFFKNLDGTERVASRNNGQFVWERPTEHVVNEWNGDLVEFKNAKIDLLVTPNHRMLLGNVDGGCHGTLNNSSEFVLRADDTAALPRRKRQKLGIPTTSAWTGADVDTKVIAPLGSRKGYRLDMRAWCEFLGLYIAEGNTSIERSAKRHRNDVVISQSSTSPRLDEVTRILDATPFRWMVQTNSKGMMRWTASSAQLADELAVLGYSWEKSVPSETKALAPQYLEALLHGFWVGDGFVKRSDHGVYEAVGYCTSSRILADDLQELIQKCGRDATILTKDMSRWPNQLAKRPAYQIVERSKNYQHLPKGKTVQYTGNVYCVTVPSGLLYVRRNGKAAWCGNSHGMLPKLLIEVANTDTWTPEQLGYATQIMNDQLSGQIQRRQQAMLLRPGMTAKQLDQIEKTYQSAYDEMLVLQIGAKFGVPQSLLGIQMKSSIGGGSQGKQQSDQSEQFATDAFKNFLIDCINDLARRFLGVGTELTMTATGGGSDDDDLTRAQADEIDVNAGIRTRNEIRAERGIPIINEPEADQLGVTISTGVSFLSGALAQQQNAASVAHQAAQAAIPAQADGALDGGDTEGSDGNADAGQQQSDAGTGKDQASSAVPTRPSGTSGASSTASDSKPSKSSTSVTPKDDKRQPDANNDDTAAKEIAAFGKFAKARLKAGGWRDFRFQHVSDQLAIQLNEIARRGDIDNAISLAKSAKSDGRPIAAGVAVRANDTGRVLMLQRALDDDDKASGKFEFPGGKLENNESPAQAAVREWQEETGVTLPDGNVTNSWTSDNDVYAGYVYTIPSETDLPINLSSEDKQVLNPDDPDGDNAEVLAWFDPDDIPDNPAVRDEIQSMPFDKLGTSREAAKSYRELTKAAEIVTARIAPELTKLRSSYATLDRVSIDR